MMTPAEQLRSAPQSLTVEIGMSNVIVSPREAALGGAETYRRTIRDGDFDVEAGIEWTPMSFPAAIITAKRLAETGEIAVVHESWRETSVREGLAETWRTKRFEEIGIVAAFPLLDHSYGAIQAIQRAGRMSRKKEHPSPLDLPVIVHPEGQLLGGRTTSGRPRQQYETAGFDTVLFQPTAEWAAAHDIPLDSRDNHTEVAAKIVKAYQSQGISGLAFDTGHWLAERNGSVFKYPQELAAALAKAAFVYEVQVTFQPFQGNIDELRAACHDQLAGTQTGELLAALQPVLPTSKPLRVVTEVRNSATAQVLAGKGRPIDGIRTINAGIRKILTA